MKGLTAEEFRDLIVSVGTHRGTRRLSPTEVAALFHQARNAGEAVDDIASAVGFAGPSMVSRFLRLLALDPQVSDLVDWQGAASTVAFSAASELARLNPEEQRSAVAIALANGMSSSEIKQAVQARVRSGKSVEEAFDDIVRLRPRVERRHVLVGAVTSQDVRNQLGTMRQSERDELLRRTLDSLDSQGLAGRLGHEQFTLAGSETAAAGLLATDDFEAVVNASLEQQLGAQT